MKKRSPWKQAVLMVFLTAEALSRLSQAAQAEKPGYGSVVNQYEISYAPGVTAEMYEPEYWERQCENPEKELLDEAGIAALNEAIWKDSSDLVNHIREADPIINGTERKICWASRRLPEIPLYRNGKRMTPADYGAYLSDILEAETSRYQQLQYVICVEQADVKAWPETETVSKDPKDPYYDEFQVSSVGVNAPALMDGQTGDGRFAHVVFYDCEGWVRMEHLAVCRDREEWIQVQEMEDFLVVSSPGIYLELSGQFLTMGTRLRLLEETESELNWGCYKVEIPCRREDGSYGTVTGVIPVKEGVCEGFLPYTIGNVLELSMSFLGDSYGWGGMYDSVDCSGLVQAVFACFGIRLPRNSASQAKIPAKQVLFQESMTQAQRKEQLDGMRTGSWLSFPGHIMIYLGMEKEEYYVLSAVGSAMLPEETSGTLPIRRVIINTLSMKRSNGITWEQEITAGTDPAG
ncbi:MAG: NlpC/P60 family protein [Lachnospiraceae bacterium]|nr:NlpC/P60 family protein [Lachnospiraceae bacterium]